MFRKKIEDFVEGHQFEQIEGSFECQGRQYMGEPILDQKRYGGFPRDRIDPIETLEPRIDRKFGFGQHSPFGKKLNAKTSILTSRRLENLLHRKAISEPTPRNIVKRLGKRTLGTFEPQFTENHSVDTQLGTTG